MTRQPAEVFPPGEFIKDTLEDRGWTQEDLAEILGRHASAVAELISGKRELNVEWARGLAEAFDTSPQVWLNLESAYRLAQGGSGTNGGIRKRARVYEKAPVREMQRRGWIAGSKDPDVLERELSTFYGVDSLDVEPTHLAFAARKSSQYVMETTPSERAWIQQVVRKAGEVTVSAYSSEALARAIPQLAAAAETEEGVEQVGRILAAAGIPFVVVKHLSGTRIDGGCVMVDDKPIIGLSLRYGRIDNFWFTLLHELGHARQGVSSLDRDLMQQPDNGDSQMGSEVYANDFAANTLLPDSSLSADLGDSIDAIDDTVIMHLSAKHRLHPGIIVGRLQHNGLYGYNQGRKHLIDIRTRVVPTVVTDGWG
ncbi:MAG: helix-turn-helix domain-containing protein [Thermomicrobiales bacterium]|nr:helix-turn-helix domain-containing protein [Thermomicrobiales bacterium]